MSISIDSTLSNIDKQIKALKEKKKNELNKMEQRVGKKLISTFNLTDQSINDINNFIDDLKMKYDNQTESKVNNG